MNNKKKIAIIGASYLQLPLVLKAKEMDLETHCFAWIEGAVCASVADFFYPISILDKEAILRQCKEIGINGITTIASDIGMPTISYVAEELGLVGNSYESSLCSTNKGRMRASFERSGVSSPKFDEITSYADLELTTIKFPLIVKPVDRSGSRGISKVDNTEDLETAIEYACSESLVGKCIVEEFVSGREVSVESISWEGKHYIITITDKVTTGAPYFVELAHHQPTNLPEPLAEKVKFEAIKALDALNVKYGAGHTEIKITDQGEIFLIEVGARMGGDFIGSHLVPLSKGFDYIEAVLNVALNRFETPSITDNSSFSGVYFLCKETSSLREVFANENAFVVEKQIYNDNLKKVANSSDRSGYLIYHSNRREELL